MAKCKPRMVQCTRDNQNALVFPFDNIIDNKIVSWAVGELCVSI